jgi:hypothetical protein
LALFDSAYLLAAVKRYSGLPTVDDSTSDATWFALLTEAEIEWKAKLAAHVPKSQWGTPVQMTTTDGGVTFVVVVGMETVTEFLGPIELRTSNRGPVITPDEYILDGATVRWPFGSARTFGAGPYIRYATPAVEIDAETDPTLMPERARMLLVFGALKRWATVGGGMRDPALFEAMETREWFGDGGATPGLLDSLLAVYPTTDAELSEGTGGAWWRSSPDLTYI